MQSLISRQEKKASRFLGKPHKIQLFTDYSIIVATRPEPTVLPPSRFSVVEIRVILCDFQGFFGGFFFDALLVSEVSGIFVIMVLSRSELCLAALHPFAMIIPELSEPPVRTLGATIPENESHIFR